MNSPEFSLMTLFTLSYISSTESPSTSAMEEIKRIERKKEQGGRERERERRSREGERERG